jgi:hypothetical protein
MSAALLLAVLAAAPAQGTPTWCAALQAKAEVLRGTDATLAQVLALTEDLPPEADGLVEAVRTHAVRTGEPRRALGSLFVGLKDGCAARPDAAALRAEADGVLKANGIDAVRQGEAITEFLMRKIGGWIMALLESDGMTKYAEIARTLFLGILALVVAFVAWRLARNRARTSAKAAEARERARIERERVRAFAEWRAEADVCLEAGDARGAWRAAQMALLARVGEVEPGAVRPARTGREILASLDDERREVCDAPLATFERTFFSGHADAEGARGFLRDVDKAADALRGAA